MKRRRRFSPEIKERAVRLVRDSLHLHVSETAAIESIAEQIGCNPEVLRRWLRKAETEEDPRESEARSDADRIRQLERENRELRKTNEILRLASAFFRQGGARPPTGLMVDFIEQHREQYGVERICRELPISPSTYYEHRARRHDPSRLPLRHHRDESLCKEIVRVHQENFDVYGARKVWEALGKEGTAVARCTVERLMGRLGLVGTTRGPNPLTTKPDARDARPDDLVDRSFRADGPNRLWVADFTYVRTRQGFVYTAFVFDVFSRMIVGWQVAGHMRMELVLDALEQALHARELEQGLVHHSDNGSQYLAIDYGSRLREAGIVPSTGTVGDSYDNAMAESLIGLYKAELINRRGPWRSREHVELATLQWVDWYNNRRLMGPLGYMPPKQYEEKWYSQTEPQPIMAGAT
ncbi:MAG: IS3 family transposase [bacterium]